MLEPLSLSEIFGLAMGVVAAWLAYDVWKWGRRPAGLAHIQAQARNAALVAGLRWSSIDTQKFVAGFGSGLWFVDSNELDDQTVIEFYSVAMRRAAVEIDDFDLGWLLAVRQRYLSIERVDNRDDLKRHWQDTVAAVSRSRSGSTAHRETRIHASIAAAQRGESFHGQPNSE